MAVSFILTPIYITQIRLAILLQRHNKRATKEIVGIICLIKIKREVSVGKVKEGLLRNRNR